METWGHISAAANYLSVALARAAKCIYIESPYG